MNLKFTAKLGLATQPTAIKPQKMDSSALKTYGMVIVRFSIQNMSGKIRFFDKTFWLADISIEMVLEIPFLILSNVNIQFDTKSFIWNSYIRFETWFTIKEIELINKHKFVKTALDKNSETFVIHVAVLDTFKLAIQIYFSQTGQVVENNSTQKAALK